MTLYPWTDRSKHCARKLGLSKKNEDRTTSGKPRFGRALDMLWDRVWNRGIINMARYSIIDSIVSEIDSPVLVEIPLKGISLAYLIPAWEVFYPIPRSYKTLLKHYWTLFNILETILNIVEHDWTLWTLLNMIEHYEHYHSLFNIIKHHNHY